MAKGSTYYTARSGSFPNQRLTEAEKIEHYGSVKKWAQEVVESILTFSGNGHYTQIDEQYRKQTNYELGVGRFNVDDISHVISPFGLADYTFPASATHYDIITPKLNLLRGEEINRPFNFRVTSVGDDLQTSKEEEKDQILLETTMGKLAKMLRKKGIEMQSQEGQIRSNESINEHMNKTFSNKRESIGQDALEHLKRAEAIEDKFNQGWFDLLVVGEEIFFTGISNGEPTVRVVNPLYFDYDRNEDTRYIEDSAWAIEWRYMAAPEIHDQFHDVLSDDDVEKIEQLKGRQEKISHINGGIPVIYTDTDTGFYSNTYTSHSNTIVKVTRCEFKSLRKMGFLTYVDEEGELQEKLVPEDYKVDRESGESVVWKWFNEVWEVTRIGDEIYVNARPKPNQHKTMDNPSKCKLGYTGIVHNRRNARSTSLVDSMKPHQYLYNIIMYRLELAIARAKGKGMIFDIAQIPRSEGIDIEKWLYYLDITGIAWINSMEEGKRGERSKFNQFKEYDMTISNTIQQYTFILDKIERMVSEISGVTPQRQGQVGGRDLVSTTERAVAQSVHITEALFYSHNEVKRRVLTNLLEEAKLAWINGKKGHYVMDDMSRTFFDIEPELFLDSDYNVFVSNSAKDAKILDFINNLAQVALQQNKADFSALVKIAQKENISDAATLLEESEEKAAAREENIARASGEGALKAQQEATSREDKKLQLTDTMNLRDNLTKLTSKDMDLQSKSADTGLKYRKTDLDEKQRRIENAIKNAKLAQDADQFERSLNVQKGSPATTQ